MQDWSEAKKRILKYSESDPCSDVFSISYEVKKIIGSSLVSTTQVAPIANFSKYTSGMSSQHEIPLQPEGVSEVVQLRGTPHTVQKHPL